MKNTSRFLLVVFSLFTSTNPLHAQWFHTNGPYGGRVLTFAVAGIFVKRIVIRNQQRGHGERQAVCPPPYVGDN